MAGELTLWRPLLDAPYLRELQRRLIAGAPPISLSGLAGSSAAATITLLSANTGRRFLIVVPDDRDRERMHRELVAFARIAGRDPLAIASMEALDADPYDGIGPHPEVVRDRVLTLDRLQSGQIDLLLVPSRALLHYVPSPEEWAALVREVRCSDTLAPEQFILDCLDLGYRRVDIVSGPSEVSRRGGILDIFPPTARQPVRIELFGDTVESLRMFDTDHQRSTGKLDVLRITPGMESPPTADAIRRVVSILEGRLEEARRADASPRPFRSLLETLQNQGAWPGFEILTRLTAARPTQLFEHVPDHLLIVQDPDRCDEELIRSHHEMRQTYQHGDNRALPGPDILMVDPLEIRRKLATAQIQLEDFIEGDGADRLAAGARSTRAYAGRVVELIEDLKKARKEKRRTIFVMRARGGVDRLREILDAEGLDSGSMEFGGSREADAYSEGGIFLTDASLVEGFDFQDPKFTLLTERDVFGEKRKTTATKKSHRTAFLSDFRDLHIDDAVVHVDHGLAKYKGLGRPKGGSLNRDFIILEFLGGDRLFVPVDRLDLVQKYSGVAGHKPVLDKLGGVSWEKVKKRARKAVASMAKDLLELYAKRKTARGYAFSPDTPWQAELEDAFPFELTPDQQTVVEAIKGDMENIRPMDRLLVGDVGFGKTEVAVRAAFKAVTDGKQVAVLAPTTVLALQHFDTFRTRFGPFPVRVEMVSRFRSVGANKAVIKELGDGSVDVLIGTHRLISKDVKFKSLGLLVVDEEQRFGVAHKERLKQMAIGVDVLSMTATPIPRTLQMSLAGVRDLSLIETPPPGRSAIQTYVLPFRQHVLSQAIRQEIRRGGQVFFVHNNIETLDTIAAKLREMVPEARILTGHGQMN